MHNSTSHLRLPALIQMESFYVTIFPSKNHSTIQNPINRQTNPLNDKLSSATDACCLFHCLLPLHLTQIVCVGFFFFLFHYQRPLPFHRQFKYSAWYNTLWKAERKHPSKRPNLRTAQRRNTQRMKMEVSWWCTPLFIWVVDSFNTKFAF